MAYFKKEMNGTWRFTADIGRDPVTGKRKQKTVRGYPTRKSAEKACAELMTDIQRGDYIDSKITVQKFVMDFLVSHVKHTVAANTYEMQKAYAVNHILPFFGDLQMNKVTALHVSKFYNQKKEEGLSAGHINNFGIFLNKVFRTAMEWGMINKNVISAVRKPSYKSKDIAVWDEDQMNKFLKETQDSRFHVVYLLALTTGMRKGEILGLQWKHVDFQNATISVQQTLVYANHNLYLKEPKSSRSRRLITIPDYVVQYLKRYKMAQPPNPLDVVVPGIKHDLLYPATLEKVYYQDLERVEVHRIRFHDMRHTHATILLKLGENPKVVQERLGHTNISTTLNTYSHVLPSMQRSVADKFELALKL